MGLKKWISNKKDQVELRGNNMAAGLGSNKQILNMLDIIISKKIKKFRKQGRPLTVNSLMVGSEVLIRTVGIPEPVIRDHIAEKLQQEGLPVE